MLRRTALCSALLFAAGPAFAGSPARVTRHDLGDQGVRYQIGKGKPDGTLVFLHGLGGEPGGELFDDLAKGLAKQGFHFKAVAPWLRSEGHLHTMTDQLERARSVIEAQPGKVVLVGHSFGGKAALALAKEFPDKVAGVVGLAPSVNMAYSYWKALTGERGLPDLATMRAKYDAHADELTRALKQAEAQGDQDKADQLRGALDELAFQRDLAGFNEPGLETHLATPTLVFHGTEDGAVSIHYARRFAAENADRVKLVELPGEGHGLADSSRMISKQLGNFAAEQLNASADPKR